MNRAPDCVRWHFTDFNLGTSLLFHYQYKQRELSTDMRGMHVVVANWLATDEHILPFTSFPLIFNLIIQIPSPFYAFVQSRRRLASYG